MRSQERPRNNVAQKAAQLDKCLITAAALLQGKSTYFATNFELSSLVETLRPRVAQAELVKLKMKALPESSDQVEQAEPDEDFERMANMDEDDQNYQGDIDERKQIPEPPDIPSDVMRNNAIRQLAEYERREHSD